MLNKLGIVPKIILLIIGASAFGGGVIALEEKVSIANLKLTPAQYRELKSDLISLVENRKSVKVSPDGITLWSLMAEKEVGKCGGITIHEVNEQNIIDKINEKIKNNCR